MNSITALVFSRSQLFPAPYRSQFRRVGISSLYDGERTVFLLSNHDAATMFAPELARSKQELKPMRLCAVRPRLRDCRFCSRIPSGGQPAACGCCRRTGAHQADRRWNHPAISHPASYPRRHRRNLQPWPRLFLPLWAGDRCGRPFHCRHAGRDRLVHQGFHHHAVCAGDQSRTNRGRCVGPEVHARWLQTSRESGADDALGARRLHFRHA